MLVRGVVVRGSRLQEGIFLTIDLFQIVCALFDNLFQIVHLQLHLCHIESKCIGGRARGGQVEDDNAKPKS